MSELNSCRYSQSEGLNAARNHRLKTIANERKLSGKTTFLFLSFSFQLTLWRSFVLSHALVYIVVLDSLSASNNRARLKRSVR